MEFNHKTALNDAVLGMMVLSYLPQIDKQLAQVCHFLCNDSFTLMEMDSGTDYDSDAKSDGYITYRTCSHCTDSDLNPYSM